MVRSFKARAGIVLVAAALLAAGFFTWQRHAQAQQRRLVRARATALLAEGRAEDARALLARAVQTHRADPVLYLQLGRALYRLRRYDEATDGLRAAVRLDPGRADAQYGLGAALAAAGRPNEAAQALRAAVRLAPGNAEAWRLLGTLPGAAPGRGVTPDEQRDALRRAWQQNPAAPRYAAPYAEALFRVGALAEAESPAQRLVVAQPNDGRSLLLLAKIQSGLPPTPECRQQQEATLRRLIQIAPQQTEAHYLLGLLCLNTARLGEARAHLERVVALEPKHEAALYNLGRVYLRLGDKAAMERHLARFQTLENKRYRERAAQRTAAAAAAARPSHLP